MEHPFVLLPVHLKAVLALPPNNQRACYVRWYQPIMNVMDWLFSNPSKHLSVTDVLVNLASICALLHHYCIVLHL